MLVRSAISTRRTSSHAAEKRFDRITRHRSKVLVVSDSVYAGVRADSSGLALARVFEEVGFEVVDSRVVPDGIAPVLNALREMTRGFAGLVVSTGGTGFSPRDLTPEATRSLLEREAPGLSEAMRAVTPQGRLSRGVTGTIGLSLVVNVPGSTQAAVQSIEAILDVVPHALELLAGGHPH
jgi:molybdenum cofactor synthesis domain-containing protein